MPRWRVQWLLFCGLVGLLILAGCSGLSGPETSLPTPPDTDERPLVDRSTEPPYPATLENVSIRHRRDICNGTCPVYSVEVCGNGTVFYLGARFVGVEGRHRFEIPRSNVTAILNASYRADFFSMPDQTTPGTDVPTHWTRVTVGNRTHTVDNLSPDSRFVPEGLDDFEATIVEETGISSMVSGGEDTDGENAVNPRQPSLCR